MWIISHRNKEEASIKKGVQQGRKLSSYLFNLHVKWAIDRPIVRKEVSVGIKILGKKIDMITFADDTAVIAVSEEDLQNF